jgi:hypothetical protein
VLENVWNTKKNEKIFGTVFRFPKTNWSFDKFGEHGNAIISLDKPLTYMVRCSGVLKLAFKQTCSCYYAPPQGFGTNAKEFWAFQTGLSANS